MMSMLQLQQAIIPDVQTAADTDSCTRVSAGSVQWSEWSLVHKLVTGVNRMETNQTPQQHTLL